MTSQSRGGGRLAAKEQSRLSIVTSDSREFTAPINQLCQILDSSFGISGSSKAIHNNSGGHVVMTSQCHRMLQCLQFSRPVLRLVATALQSHVTNYMDQGLFAGRLGIHLIKALLELGTHKHLVMEVLSKLLKLCIECLDSKKLGLKTKLSTDSKEKLAEMIQLVKGVIGTKSLCGLSEGDLQHIAMLAVETYISSSDQIHKEIGSNVHYIQLEGYQPSESRLLNGLLFQTPSIPTYASSVMQNIIRVPSGDDENGGRIRTVLVSVSLAGDSEEFMNTVQWQGPDVISIEDAVVDRLLAFGETLVLHQVGLLACQKVVHPELRQYLESHHVIVIDRLGSTHANLFQKLTGGEEVRSVLIGSFAERSYGYVDSMEHCVYGGRSYVHLQTSASPVLTVLLANISEHALAELKAMFEASLCTLGHCEREGSYLPGSGCWQALLTAHLYSQAHENLESWCQELNVSRHVLGPIISCFASCLIRAGLPLAEPAFVHSIDTSYGHHWNLPSSIPPERLFCACGTYQHSTHMKFNEVFSFTDCFAKEFDKSLSERQHSLDNKRKPAVIDCFAAARNALHCGVSIATMVIGIANVITDTN